MACRCPTTPGRLGTGFCGCRTPRPKVCARTRLRAGPKQNFAKGNPPIAARLRVVAVAKGGFGFKSLLFAGMVGTFMGLGACYLFFRPTNIEKETFRQFREQHQFNMELAISKGEFAQVDSLLKISLQQPAYQPIRPDWNSPAKSPEQPGDVAKSNANPPIGDINRQSGIGITLHTVNGTNRTSLRQMPPRRAILFAPKIDELQMQFIPVFLRENDLKSDSVLATFLPSLRPQRAAEPENMRIPPEMPERRKPATSLPKRSCAPPPARSAHASKLCGASPPSITPPVFLIIP